jgi:RNA polymerase sigma-70 factor (ECF subfamily)
MRYEKTPFSIPNAPFLRDPGGISFHVLALWRQQCRFTRLGDAVMLTTSMSLLERLCQPGERLAWDRFVDLYTPLLFSWARRVGLKEADAADLVQDVFVTLVQTMPTFVYDRQGSFRAWLKTVTLNKWRNRCKKIAKGPVAADNLAEVASPDALEAFWDAQFQQQLARRALEILQSDFQPATWQAFWEHVVNNRPAPEVAQQLGLTAGAVYAAKYRVLDRLRQELTGMMD